MTLQCEQACESLKQEALASLSTFQEKGQHLTGQHLTGQHLTGQQVRTWLNTWGTDNERAAPECHK